MGGHPGQGSDARSGRDKRLAEALRANLKRRKAQQRERAAAAGETSGDGTPSDKTRGSG